MAAAGNNPFAALAFEEVDAEQPANPKKAAALPPVSQRKQQLQKQAAKKDQAKTKKKAASPALQQAKPLVLPDNVAAQRRVFRRPKPEPIPNNGQAQDQKEIEEAPESPRNFTLKEYEEGLLAKKKDNLDGLKKQTERRSASLEKDFESMKIIGKKKDDTFSTKKGIENDKKLKEKDSSSKTVSFTECLKPFPGQRSFANQDVFRMGSSGWQEISKAEVVPVISFEDPGQFPVLKSSATAKARN